MALSMVLQRYSSHTPTKTLIMTDFNDITPLEELVNLSTLTDSDLDKIGQNESARIMLGRTIPFLYKNEEAITITEENYTSTLRALRQRYKEGSQALSEVIVSAQKLGLAHDVHGEDAVYRNYIATSEMPFYKRIAEAHLHKDEGDPEP